MKRPWPVMTLVMLTIFVVMTGVAMTYPEGARFQPLVIGLPAIALCLLQLVLDMLAKPAGDVAASTPATLRPESGPPPALRRELIVWSYLLGFVAALHAEVYEDPATGAGCCYCYPCSVGYRAT